MHDARTRLAGATLLALATVAAPQQSRQGGGRGRCRHGTRLHSRAAARQRADQRTRWRQPGLPAEDRPGGYGQGTLRGSAASARRGGWQQVRPAGTDRRDRPERDRGHALAAGHHRPCPQPAARPLSRHRSRPLPRVPAGRADPARAADEPRRLHLLLAPRRATARWCLCSRARPRRRSRFRAG